MTLSDFLLARIAEDEAMADLSIQVGDKGASLIAFGQPDAPPVMLIHPARVLAECAAKRRIVELHNTFDPIGDIAECIECETAAPCGTLQLLALPYADHPDYREEWRP